MNFILSFITLAVFIALPAMAQGVPAVPVEDVQTEKLMGTRTDQLTVLELFSSQACVFCPKADAMLGDLIQNEDVIGLSCHIDYLDVSEGSLSRPFCTERQNMYEAILRAGPNFTPQVIINGAYDAVGYKLEDVAQTIQNALAKSPARIKIEALPTPNSYSISLPAANQPGPSSLQALFIDNPHTVTIAEGSNRGKTVTYYNIVSRIDPVMEWDGTAKMLKAKVVLAKRHKGFVLLAPGEPGQGFLAAGQYVRPATAEKPQ